MRPACEISVALQELEAARTLGIYTYMQRSRISEIAVAMSAMMPSAVTFLLSAVLLVLCEYGNGLKLAIIYNSELLQYCIEVAFIVTSKLEGLFCYF
jgi:hypothetical protein